MAGEEYSFNSIRKALYIQGSTDRTSSFGIVSGGQYNSTLPTLSDGAFTHLQTDNRGRLLVDMNGVTFTGDVNVDAFQTQAGVGADAKVNNNRILVVQTGAGTDSSTMADEIATESTATAISSKLTTINSKLVTGTVIGDVNAIQSGTWDINDITGIISLPTGAATENTLANVLDALTLDEKEYDTIELTYVAPGNNGAGEVATVTYKDGSTTLYTLTLTYNSDDKLASVVRS